MGYRDIQEGFAGGRRAATIGSGGLAGGVRTGRRNGTHDFCRVKVRWN